MIQHRICEFFLVSLFLSKGAVDTGHLRASCPPNVLQPPHKHCQLWETRYLPRQAILSLGRCDTYKGITRLSCICYPEFLFIVLISESPSEPVEPLVCNRWLQRILIRVKLLLTGLKVQELGSGCDASFWHFCLLFLYIPNWMSSFSSHGHISPLSLLSDGPGMPEVIFFMNSTWVQGPRLQIYPIPSFKKDLFLSPFVANDIYFLMLRYKWSLTVFSS